MKNPNQGWWKMKKVKDNIYPQITDTDEEVDIEEKRESLAILASTGTIKDYLGVQMSLGDVNKLSIKGVKKYYYRYQSKLAKQVTDGLIEKAINLASKTISRIVTIDNPASLSYDLETDRIVKRELVNAAEYAVLKGGCFVALVSALYHIVNHIEFTINKDVLVEPPKTPEEPEHDAEES